MAESHVDKAPMTVSPIVRSKRKGLEICVVEGNHPSPEIVIFLRVVLHPLLEGLLGSLEVLVELLADDRADGPVAIREVYHLPEESHVADTQRIVFEDVTEHAVGAVCGTIEAVACLEPVIDVIAKAIEVSGADSEALDMIVIVGLIDE